MYQYVGCGLDNVQLRNGYEVRRTTSGTEVVHIDDVAGLHRALAQWVCDLSRPLTPKEFKFLRKELDMSQRQVAMMAGVDEQTVSLWERGQSPINQAAERLLRVLMKEHISGNAEVQAALERFCALDRAQREQEETAVELEAAPEWRIAA
jgi:DNA-binding transcriptional regulator YiaG